MPCANGCPDTRVRSLCPRVHVCSCADTFVGTQHPTHCVTRVSTPSACRCMWTPLCTRLCSHVGTVEDCECPAYDGSRWTRSGRSCPCASVDRARVHTPAPGCPTIHGPTPESRTGIYGQGGGRASDGVSTGFPETPPRVQGETTSGPLEDNLDPGLRQNSHPESTSLSPSQIGEGRLRGRD